MADKELLRLMRLNTPSLNPDIAQGLAVKHMEEAEAYLAAQWRAVGKNFPEEVKYVDLVRTTPQEEFNEETRKKMNRCTFDTAKSYLYMMKLILRCQGEDIIKYIKMPYVKQSGVLLLGGSRFVISPVAADKIMSIDRNSIFIRLGRAKDTYQRCPASYTANGARETVQIVWALLYNKGSKHKNIKPVIRANTCLVHYLLCKFGFAETFQRYAGVVPDVLDIADVNANAEKYKDWVICKSSGIKPSGYKSKDWKVPRIVLAFPKEKYTPQVKNLVAGFYYVLDHFPHRLQPEWLNKTEQWRVLMGELIFSSDIQIGTLHEDISDHILSLDEYIDINMRIKFREIGLDVDDIWQLFGYMIERFNDWLLDGAEKISSLYGKELSVLYYVFSDMVNQINTFYFKLRAASKKATARGEKLTKREVEQLLETIKTGAIYSLTKNHGEISTTTTSGDNMALKITGLLVPQSKSTNRTNHSDAAILKDPSMRADVSTAEVGGFSNLPKTDPSGHSRVNRFVRLDRKATVLRNPSLAPLLDEVQALIKRK